MLALYTWCFVEELRFFCAQIVAGVLRHFDGERAAIVVGKASLHGK
jgi:hypothetical protein